MKVDWVTWLGSDLTHDGSDKDSDFIDTEEDEESDDFSDNDLCDLDFDHVQILCELFSELSQAQVAVACHVLERKRFQDKIGELEQQLEMAQRAASSESSAKDDSAHAAEGLMLLVPASASLPMPTLVPAPTVSAAVAEDAEELLDNSLMVYSF